MDKKKLLGIAATVVAAPMLVSAVLIFLPEPHQERYYHLFFMIAPVVYMLVLSRHIMTAGIDEWHPGPWEACWGLWFLIEWVKGFYWFCFSF